jgi:nucleotide-binding universal stress UspA family protein
MFRHILLPTDGSALSQTAVENGIQFAKSIRARITGLCVVIREFAFDAEMLQSIKDQSHNLLKEKAEKVLGDLKSAAHGAGVECDVVLETALQPYEAIVNTAESKGCDLIMMASHGRKGVSALLLGSETQKVLTHSKIPVLVYR